VSRFVLALDQGTTSSRALVFDHSGSVIALAQEELPQIYPQPGSVEHDPESIWQSQLRTARMAMERAGLAPRDVAAIGITNQRETTVLWERRGGKPVANAIVWQSRISTPICERLKAQGAEPLFRSKTGLLLDPYFSGTKITHLLESHAGLRARAESGEILFGTIETFLIWRLTGGRCHVTDVSNASRTLMFNIHSLAWDDELLNLLAVPRTMLPEVRASSEVYGETEPALLGAAVPIAGTAGDQQAALFGQACFESGMAKNTYGTGCFLLLNTGATAKFSKSGLLTTVGWQLNNKTTYCLEGAVFIAGAVVQWLRDGLGVIRSSKDVEQIAAQDAGGVFFVPAFVGLGAPHWDPYARGAMFGLTRDTTAGQIARAALESIAYQTRDVLQCMKQDSGVPLSALRVDGGAATNNALMQFQADMLGIAVHRPRITETTALGAAYLAGLAVGYWRNTQEIAQQWQCEREFAPTMDEARREHLYRRWKVAVSRALRWQEPETSSAAPAKD
jgi:glycerol kinase